MKYYPFTKNGVVGLKCVSDSGRVTYIYFNASDVEDSGDEPNVFVYMGPSGDPADDYPMHHYNIPQ